ncbi:MAG: hypothetical protein HY055_00235 [Magnetospirillum sp.]|nr:hypothetical protein [Magnetospirillum sp.]
MEDIVALIDVRAEAPKRRSGEAAKRRSGQQPIGKETMPSQGNYAASWVDFRWRVRFMVTCLIVAIAGILVGQYLEVTWRRVLFFVTWGLFVYCLNRVRNFSCPRCSDTFGLRFGPFRCQYCGLRAGEIPNPNDHSWIF